MDSDPDNLWLQLLLLVFLTALNAFFAGAEMALVSASPSKLSQKAEEGNKKAAQVLELLKEPSRFLSTIQIVITLAGFFNSASAATGISRRLEAVLDVYKRQVLGYGDVPFHLLVVHGAGGGQTAAALPLSHAAEGEGKGGAVRMRCV